MKTLYFDVCALCRPFDDQQQLRIRLETDALYWIIRQIEAGQYRPAVSPAHFLEVGAIREREERTEITALLQRLAPSGIACNSNEARARANALHAAGIGSPTPPMSRLRNRWPTASSAAMTHCSSGAAASV